METRHTCVSFLMLLLLVFCAANVFAQEVPGAVRAAVMQSTGTLPVDVLGAVLGPQRIVAAAMPREIANIVIGRVAGEETTAAKAVVALKKNKPRKPIYICRNADQIDGTANFGTITAYSTLIEKSVARYWQEYSNANGSQTANWSAYVQAVKRLNPQIADVGRICKGFVIRLPFAGSVGEPSRDDRDLQVASLQERVRRLESNLSEQAELLNNKNSILRGALDSAAIVHQQFAEALKLQQRLQEERPRLYETIMAKDKELLARDKMIEGLQTSVVVLQQEADASNLRQEELEETVREKDAELLSRDTTITNLRISLDSAEDALILRGEAVVLLAAVIVVILMVLLFSMHRLHKLRMQQHAAVQHVHQSQPTKVDTLANSDISSLPRGSMLFVYRGKGIPLKAVEVRASCLDTVYIANLDTHRRDCPKTACARITPLTAAEKLNFPLGCMPYYHDDGTVEAIRVISAEAPCGVTVKLRNMAGHMENCVSQDCIDTCKP